jgi:hypothetical protein
MSPEEREEWQAEAVQVLERIAHWWESDAPGRRLGAEEAHELGNVITWAKALVRRVKEAD